MPTLCLYLLGSLDVTWDEQVLPKPPTLKSQSLLAYLASHRERAHPRSQLAGLLWGDRPEQKARASLSTSLWHIRRCLPDEEFLIGDPHSVQFNPEVDVWLDTEEFIARSANGNTRELEAAVALYRGDFLEAFYDEWVVEERYRLAVRCCEALARLMHRQEAEGQYHAALETAGRLLERDPLREDAHCLAMRAYCRLGQRSGALEQYRRCREALLEELGVEPAAETRQYYQAILEGRVEIGRPTPAGAVRRETVVTAAGAGDPLDVAAVSPLVGREEELRKLHGHWRRALAGQGGLLLVRGEAGVGKTRLLREFAARPPSQAERVLWGRCYEFERLLPYQPIVEALQGCRAYLNATDVPDWARREVGRLLPEAGEQHGRLSERGQPEPEEALLFEGVVAFLGSLAGERPCLLVVEDLHWASESTLQMLHYLVRHLPGKPVVLVGTYRPEAVGLAHALRGMARRLGREGLSQVLDLHRLGAEAVEELVVAMSGAGEAVLPLARRLHADTDGNPFFLMETIKALFSSGALRLEGGIWRGDYGRISKDDIPLASTVSQAIHARSARLAPQVQKALRLASVLGREFDFDLLNAVLGQGEEATLEALDDLLRHRLIEEGSGPAGRDYAFSHHKIREVIYAGIPKRRRQHAHARVGAAMEALRGTETEGLAAELAHHYEQGRHVDGALVDKAIHYQLLAGDQSRLAYAHEEAVAQYERALALLQEKEDWSGAARTLMKLGLTYHNAFQFDRAREAYDEGFVLWRRASERRPRGRRSPGTETLRLPTQEPRTLDPRLSGGFLNAPLFSALLELTPDLEIVPGVARSWEILDGGRRYVFRLRDDVRWSDGVPVTATDFVPGCERALNPTNVPCFTNIQLGGSSAAGRGDSIVGQPALHAWAQDATTLIIELETPSAYLLQALACGAFPLPRHVIEIHGEAGLAPENVVTCGPYRIESWQHGVGAILVRDPAYYGQFTGNVDRVEVPFLSIQEWPRALEMYEAGALDQLDPSPLPGPTLIREWPRHRAEIVFLPSTITFYYGFRVDRPPLDDIQVRRALSIATDPQEIMRMTGCLKPATGGFLPPGMPGHSPGLNLPYDPRLARELLSQAGYPGGRGLGTLKVLLLGYPITCVFYQEMQHKHWAEGLGLDLDWELLDWDEYQLRLASDPPDIFVGYWGPHYHDPDSFLRVGVPWRAMGWQSDAYRRLIAEAGHITDPERRMALYRQADRMLIEDAVLVPVEYGQIYAFLLKPWVKRFPTAPPYRAWMLQDVVIDRH